MRRSRRHALSDDGGLDLTSLLDVIFNLVFFFIVATTIRSADTFLDFSLAEASEAAERESDDPVPVISIGRDGSLRLDDIPKTEAELEASLRSLAEENADSPLILRPDSEASWQMTVNAMNLAVKAGLRNINAQVDQPRAEAP